MKTRNSLTLAIFGVTGDLYQNKLASSLFNLFSNGFLPSEFKIVGFARRPLTNEEFRNFTKEAISKKNKIPDQKTLSSFLEKLQYLQGDLENLESFKDLSHTLSEKDKELGFCSNKLFYLAVPPNLYESIFNNISKAGLTIPCAPGLRDKDGAWTRVLVEKPFGRDMAGAIKLDKMLGELFDESQVFRIDHYLGKEALRNILSFRFEHGELEHKWNKENIQKIRILFYEEDIVGKRGALYENLGILRDVGQNHMLQMLALVTMENPGGTSMDTIRDSRQKALEQTDLNEEKKIIRGQYKGYLNEKGVNPDSKTETFFRFFLKMKNKRWEGVEFELEGGKALDKSEVVIEVHFKNQDKPHKFLISGYGGIGEEAYEKVLYDCISGDQTIFTTTGEILAEWRIVERVIEKWQSEPLKIYNQGTSPEMINEY
ncbi:MAG: glucose-6-phosphate dehydrogenase [Candidatus Paceibacterota bacterium]